MISSRAALASLSGARISSVEVLTDGPSLPGLAHYGSVLHPVTRTATIRRQLLFAAGDTIDTLLVGETLRRLRRLRLYSDAVVMARQCDGTGDAALTIRTRDAWSLRPTARLRASNQLSLGIEEKNLFGSGRSLSLTHEMTTRGSGAAVSLNDPWLFGSDVAGSIRVATLGGAHTLRAGLRNHEYSVFDRWRLEGNLARHSYGDTNVAERTQHTVAAMAMVARRVGSAPHVVTLLAVGVEFDSAAAVSAAPSRRLAATPDGPRVRSYLGVDLGLQRRTAVFDTVGWVAPGRGFLDVPLGWESDAIVGGGWERVAHTPAMRLDGWMGRIWLPRRGALLMLDGWASGYLGRGVDRNQIVRASVSWFAEARGGMWGGRASAERLAELDPDLRGLSLMPKADYTTPVLGVYAPRGGRSVAASAERNFHLLRAGASSMLDLGGFLAGSYRWDVRDVAGERLKAGVVGTRLRLLSANGAVSSVRVDLGYPVVRSAALPNHGFLVLTVGSLFDVSRQRDGRRVF